MELCPVSCWYLAAMFPGHGVGWALHLLVVQHGSGMWDWYPCDKMLYNDTNWTIYSVFPFFPFPFLQRFSILQSFSLPFLTSSSPRQGRICSMTQTSSLPLKVSSSSPCFLSEGQCFSWSPDNNTLSPRDSVARTVPSYNALQTFPSPLHVPSTPQLTSSNWHASRSENLACS